MRMYGKAVVKEKVPVAKRTGIGINNVRQRLQFLYKGKYDLQIKEEEEVFVVDLRVELQKMENRQEVETLAPPPLNTVYA